jgi:3-deoxy-D-manno-octulosonic-acid transferase
MTAKFFYGLVIRIYSLGIRLAALSGNQKAKEWVDGRKNWRDVMRARLSSASSNTGRIRTRQAID